MAEMFHDVMQPPATAGTKTGFTVAASIAAHVCVLALLVGVSVFATGALPTPQSAIMFAMPVPPPMPAMPPAPTPAAPTPSASPDPTPAAPDPVATAATIPTESPASIAPSTTLSSVATGSNVSDITGVAGATGVALPGVAGPPSEPLRVGGQIEAPVKMHDAAPVYPKMAQAAKVAGVVIIEATIGVDGRVTNARVVRSVPLLDQAAVEAVKQWVYKPTMLNGVPVPVLMTVTVNFAIK